MSMMMGGSVGKKEFEGVGVVLLDIEGTICPISFVKDVLFPYFLRTLPETLADNWSSPTLAPYINAYPAPHNNSPSALLAHTRDLMYQDSKAPYLKSLQGHLFQAGYASGVLKCPLFPDVAPAIRRWVASGRKVMIYSSGSVGAQKLLMQYTTETEAGREGDEKGDLRGLVTGWWDTVNAGSKREAESYERICQGAGVGGGELLFLSDRWEEVEAARRAGMEGVVVVREGNERLEEGVREKFGVVESFGDVVLL